MVKRIFLPIALAATLLFSSLALYAGERIDINTASVQELMLLKGVGAKKAEAIVAYREQNGAFQTVEDLSEVRGIGESTVEDNLDLMEVVGPLAAN